jgi:hypothetical protein
VNQKKTKAMVTPISEMVIRAIGTGDRATWEPLWDGYLNFNEKTVPQEVTELT